MAQRRSGSGAGPRREARKPTATSPAPEIPSEAEEAKERLARNVIRWIKVIGWGMGLTVASIEILNAPYDRLTRNFDNTALMKVGLLIFFFGWLWGATNDTEIQRVGYCATPNDRLGLKEAGGILLFLAVFVALFVLHDNLVWFQLFLLAFILVNTVTWRIVFNFTLDTINTSYAKLRNTGTESRGNCSLAKLLVVVQYMNGPWQRRRFVTLIILAILQVAAALLVSRGTLAPYVGGLSVHGVSGAVLLGYAPGVLFVLYVLISEIWMKIYRIKVFAELNTIDEFERHFVVSKRREADLPTPHLAGHFDFSPCSNRNYIGQSPLKWVIDTFIPG